MITLKAPLRVLYLEDNPVDADLTRRELSRQAPEIKLENVTSLAEARVRLAPDQPGFDILLTDLLLPDGNGLELLAEVRDRNLPLAVVIITGSGDQDAAVSALKAGADDYLVKRTDCFNNLPQILSTAHSRFKAIRERRARPLRVLYAEPNSFDSDLTRRHLAIHARHIRLEVVGSGLDILARLPIAADNAQLPFDVLLLDFRLPGMDALEVTKVLRQERQLDIPIVLVTGHGNEELALQALRLGVDEYLVKHDGYLLQLPLLLEKIQKQAELLRSEARYHSLFKNNHAVMLVINPVDGRIVDANPAAGVFYGYGPETLRGMNISEINTLSPAQIREEQALALAESKNHFNFRHRLANGEIRDVEVFCGPIELSGQKLLYSIIHDVTERKLAEEGLLLARFCLDHAAIGIFQIDQQGGIVDVNELSARSLGYSSEELRGMRVFDIDPDFTRESWLEHRRNIHDKSPSTFETHHRRKDGTVFPVEVTVNFLDYAGKTISFSFVQDITKRKQAEKALRESEANFRALSTQFHALLDAIPDSITLQSPELRILWANNGAVAGSAWKPQEVVGMHCYTFWHGKTEPCGSCPVQESLRTGKPATSTVGFTGGVTKELRTIPILEADRVVNVIMVGRDITEHRKLEDQLRHSLKMESIGTLAGGIAHDFNNILTAIIGYGNLALMDMPEKDPRRGNIQCMLDGTDRAVHLTKDLLQFSRKQPGEKKPVNLNEIVEKIEKFLKKVIREDIEYTTRRLAEPIPVLADSHQLEQVLMNLATNARDAMPDGGSLTVTTEQITIDEGFVAAHGFGKPGAYALVTVTDTGQGISGELQQRIFDPFFTTKEVGKGTGLGLAVVYGIIKQHDGFINVYSEPGNGTTFRIYLPLSPEESRETTLERQEEAPARGTETILLAEDDAMVRNLTKTVLQEFGYTVIECTDGEDAVRKFLENRDVIDMLLFDLIMPKLSGTDAYDKIRRSGPDVKAIFTSGYATEIIMQKGLFDKGIPLISKPMSPKELAQKVRSVLDGTST
jgi:two-component system, cell cycle sensor histidine kinase and response regulator CckA